MWNRLWRSVWDGQVYREAAAGRVGGSLGYLTLLVLLATVVTTFQVQTAFSRSVWEFKQSRWWENNFPEIQLTQGKVSSPAKQPVVVEQKDFVFILDTTGAITDLDPKYPEGLLLTQTELLYRRQRGVQETHRIALEGLPDFTLNQATVEQILDRIKAWVWLVVGVVLTFWWWIVKLLQVLFWSLLGLLVNALTKRSLPYRAIFNIGVLALTVSLAFDLITGGLGLRVTGLGFISLALYVGYLIWGILVQPKPTEAI